MQAQLQAAHQDQMQQQQHQQQPQGGQPNVSEGVPVGQNPATPGVDPPGFTYRNRSRRKASEKPVVRTFPSLSAAIMSSSPSTEGGECPCVIGLLDLACGSTGPLLMNLLCFQGSSQIRQSFSKRKRGIAQKAYQLFKITDAKVPHFGGFENTKEWS